MIIETRTSQLIINKIKKLKKLIRKGGTFMNKALAVFVIFLTVTSCAVSQKKTGSFAQEKTIPKEAFEKLANDLSQLQEEIELTQTPRKITPRDATKADSIKITKDKALVYAGADERTKT